MTDPAPLATHVFLIVVPLAFVAAVVLWFLKGARRER
jgi:hypothetical protein